MVTAAGKHGIVAGREIADRGRGSCRLCLALRQLPVKLFPCDIFSIHIFFSINDENTWNHLNLMLLDEELRDVAGGICNDAEFHDGGFSRSSQSSRYLRFQSIRNLKAITRPQASAIQNSRPRRLKTQKSGAISTPVRTLARAPWRRVNSKASNKLRPISTEIQFTTNKDPANGASPMPPRNCAKTGQHCPTTPRAAVRTM